MTKKANRQAGAFLEGLSQPAPEAAFEAAAEAVDAYDAYLSIDDIQPHPYNRTVDIEDESAAALRESVAANGFTDRVQVLTRENAEALGVTGLGPQPYVALNCHHRLAICRKYRPDIRTVEAVIRTFRTPLEMLYVIADYNAARPLKQSERADQIRRLKIEVAKELRPGEDTFSVIADRLGKSRTLVYMLDAISDLPRALMPWVDSGDIILRDAVELRKLPADAQGDLALALASLPSELEGEGRKTAVRRLLAAAKGEPRRGAEPAKKSCDLARSLTAVRKLLPEEGDAVTLPKYRKKLEPMVRNLDESIRILADWRRSCGGEYPLPQELKAALEALLAGQDPS